MWDIVITVSVILLVVAFFAILIGRYIYKKVHHIPTGDCACCKANSTNLVKLYHKKYKK